MEDGRPMSGTGGETVVVLESGEDCRSVASSPRRAKVAHAQALIICFLGVALTWTNATKEYAVGKSRDQSDASNILLVALVTKSFGLLWALYSAPKAFWKGDTDSWSGGPPILITWGATSTGAHPGKNGSLMSGFAFQAIGTWLSAWDIVFGEDLGTTIAKYVTLFVVSMFWGLYVGPTVRYFQERLGDPGQMCPVQICIREKREIPARALSTALALVFLTGPIAVYTLESVLIFVSWSSEPAAYILAVLDVVTVIFALPFLCSFVVRMVPQLWGGEWVGRSTRFGRV